MTTIVWVLYFTITLPGAGAGPDQMAAIYRAKASCENRANRENAQVNKVHSKYFCLAQVVLP